MDAGFGALGVSIGGLGTRLGLALRQSVMRSMHSRCRQWNRGGAVWGTVGIGTEASTHFPLLPQVLQESITCIIGTTGLATV
jgi:hypothetical protein